MTSPKAKRRRSPRWRRWLLIVGAALALLVLAAVILIVVVVHRLNTPATVPKSWRPPAALPISTSSLVPPGNLVFDSDRTGNYEIWTMGASGADPHQLTDDPTYDSWWARISPDRRTILFYRTPRGVHDRNYSKTSLWAMAANGTGPVELRPAGLDGWAVQGHAEWSPDGKHLVMFGGKRTNPQIWVTDDLGRNPRAISHRSGTNIDPSWSPSGQMVVFAGCPESFCLPGHLEVYAVPATGGKTIRMTHDSLEDNDPYFSHDGTQLAWLTKVSGGITSVGAWDIRTLGVRENGPLLDVNTGSTPRRLVNDNNINSKPAWSLDDRSIYFHRAVGSLKDGFQIWSIHPDGTGLHEITAGQPGSNEYPGT